MSSPGRFLTPSLVYGGVALSVIAAFLGYFGVVPLPALVLLGGGLTVALVVGGLRGKGWRATLPLLAFWSALGLTQALGPEDTATSRQGKAADGARFHLIDGDMAPGQVGAVFGHLLVANLNLEDAPAPRLCLDSFGGDTLAGLAMAQVVNLFGNTEVVTRRCESACVYVLAAADEKTLVGRRTVGGTNHEVVGLHRTRAARQLPGGDLSTKAPADWFTELGVRHLRGNGVSEALTQKLRETPSHCMHYPSPAELFNGGLGDRAIRPSGWSALCSDDAWH